MDIIVVRKHYIHFQWYTGAIQRDSPMKSGHRNQLLQEILKDMKTWIKTEVLVHGPKNLRNGCLSMTFSGHSKQTCGTAQTTETSWLRL